MSGTLPVANAAPSARQTRLRKNRMVLLGPPASGKGTQAELIQARYGIQATSTGAMLRDELRRGTALGNQAAEITGRGGLVPDSVVLELVEQWLAIHDGSFIFDGFPRTVPQAEALEALLARRGTALEIVFYFNVPLETIHHRVLNRLQCGACGRIVSIGLQVKTEASPCPSCGGTLHRRADDTEAVLAQRMAEYEEKTAPLVGFYRGRGLLVELHGAERPEAVFSAISAALETA